MLPTGWIAHELPGRMRVHIPERRRDERFFELAQQKLAATPGITKLDVNALTGNILMLHELDCARIAAIAESHQLFHLNQESADGPRTRQAGANHSIGSFVRLGPLSPYDRLALVFAALAVAETLQGNVMAPAVTLFWYALRLWQLRVRTDDKGVAAAV